MQKIISRNESEGVGAMIHKPLNKYTEKGSVHWQLHNMVRLKFILLGFEKYKQKIVTVV
jgi:hypothetical protein